MTEFGPFRLDNWPIKRIIKWSLIVHVITAYFSEGFFQFDEHFQVLEFLNYKLNGSPASELPWEYKEQIRPWFQVFIYYLLIAPLNFLGVSSPFFQAFILRLFTSLIGLYSVFSLKDFLLKEFDGDEKKQKVALILMQFSWFVPVIHSRASSESLSASLILIGFSYLYKSLNRECLIKSFISGLLFGAAYLVKAQLSLVVAFLWFWLVFSHPKFWKTYITISLAIIFSIFLGILFDYWGYGEWTFSTWNYFQVNILQDRVSGFGIDPWWKYFKFSLMKGVPPLSIAFMAAYFLYWWKNPKSPVFWMTAPFFLIHCLIGHKELRFIFFVVLLAPFVLVKILDEYQKLDSKIVKIFVYLNLIILVPVGLKSANSSIRFFKYISKEKVQSFYAHNENPYQMVGLKMNFYHPKGLDIKIFKEDPKVYNGKYFFRSGQKYFELSNNKNCRLEYLSYPKFALNFNIGNWIKRSRVWSLWDCKAP